MSYIHWGIDLTDGFIVCWKLIYLHAIAHQLTHYLNFELVELTLGDCIGFGNDGDDVDLRGDRKSLQDSVLLNNI